MKKIAATLSIVALASVGLAAPAAQAAKPTCNWGQLTAEAIAGGFDQGAHSSSFAGLPRAGLANVVNQGDMNATCEFIAGALVTSVSTGGLGGEDR